MEIRKQLEQIREDNPQNIMAQTFDLGRFESLSTLEQEKVFKIIRSGIDNPESQVGAYAMDPTDYEKFDWLLDPIVEKYHDVSPDFKQGSDWDLKGNFDLLRIDPRLNNVSMRVRVARNTTEFPLPGSMDKEQRVDFEKRMVEVFEKLIVNPKFGGRYMSLTPNSSYKISDKAYAQLVAEHKMFKDMSADPYLKSAGISADWPWGRGLYVSSDENLIVWVNEEDQLRIVSMAIGSDLSLVFKNLVVLLDAVESSGLTFAVSERFGNVTSCPSNIGTGMRASIHIALPKLVKKEAKLKAIARSHGLSVRGLGGEHTAYGEDGLVDISPRARLGVTEAEILKMLFEGIQEMLKEERSI